MLILAWWNYHEENASAREYAAKHDTATPKKPIEIKCRLSSRAQLICLSQVPDSDAADEHTQKDLKAQQDSAEWAYLSMLLNGIGVVTSVFVSLFVVLTFWETKRQVRIAQRAYAKERIDSVKQFELAERQYLTQSRPKIKVLEPTSMLVGTDKGGRIFASVPIENIGDFETPFAVLMGDIKDYERLPHTSPAKLRNRKSIKDTSIIRPGGHLRFDIVSEFSFSDIKHDVYCLGVIYYIDGREIERETGFCFKWDDAANTWTDTKDSNLVYIR